MKNLLIFCSFFTFLFSSGQEISVNRVKDIVATLAADSMQGRKFRTPQNLEAAQYIAKQFEKNKLDYCIGDSYLVPFKYKDGHTYYNVCGLKKGVSPRLIALGAHFDHIGLASQGEDKIYNGADDNASGVAAVIALSDYYKDKKPREGILFMAFNAEEIGLVGSRYLSEDSGFQQYRPQITLLLNFEMLGTISEFGKNKVFITGSELSNLQHILNTNAPKGFEIVDDPYTKQHLFFRSDNVNFFKKGIVAHSLSTVDMKHQNHYHRVNDDINLIAFDNLTQIINSFAKTLDHMMEQDFAPQYIDKLKKTLKK